MTHDVPPICHKKAYLSKKEAKAVVKSIARHSRRDKKPKRAYQCPRCGNWHLTSMSIEEYRTNNQPIMQKNTVPTLLSHDEKRSLAKEFWAYHDATVQNDCAFYYCEKFDVGVPTFKQQLSGYRNMRPSQSQFVIDYLFPHTSERGIREIFARLFQAQPEAYGYLITESDPLPFDPKPAPAL